jgi:hypothetical protein
MVFIENNSLGGRVVLIHIIEGVQIGKTLQFAFPSHDFYYSFF